MESAIELLSENVNLTKIIKSLEIVFSNRDERMIVSESKLIFMTEAAIG